MKPKKGGNFALRHVNLRQQPGKDRTASAVANISPGAALTLFGILLYCMFEGNFRLIGSKVETGFPR